MKVGIYLPPLNSQVGGGYTFETEARKALIRLQSNSEHTFVFLGWDKDPPTDPNGHRIAYIPLSLTAAERLLLKKEQYKRLAVRTWKHLRYTALQSEPFRENLIETLILRKLRKNQVQFICYFAQNSCLTMEIPYLTIVWDLQHRLQPFFPEVSAKGEWERREQFFSKYLRRASWVIVGTNTGRAEVESFYQIPSGRIRILPHPTPDFALQPAEEIEESVLTRYQIPPGFLFYPAQFWSHKNHVLILKALHLLRSKSQLSIPLVLVGSDMGNLSYVRKITKDLGLTEQVHFLGFVTQRDLIALYRRAFALVYVTFFGPENLPPLEAFALGCPVIATDVAGAQEQLGDAALLVNPKKETELADAILRLHHDPSLVESLRQKGLQRATKSTFEEFIKSIFRLLDEFESDRRCWE